MADYQKPRGPSIMDLIKKYPTHIGSGRIIYPSAPVFTPFSISNLMVYLDANRLPDADGTSITSWTDYSGNGRHAIGSGAGRPVLKRNIMSGKSVMRGDGTNTLATSTIPATPEWTIAVVGRRIDGNPNTNERLVDLGTFISIVNNGLSAKYNDRRQWSFYSDEALAVVNGGPDMRYFGHYVIQYKASACNIFFDGAQKLNFNPSDTGASITSLNMFALGGPTNSMKADIPLVIMWGKIINEDERVSLSQYLAGYVNSDLLYFVGDSHLDEDTSTLISLVMGYYGNDHMKTSFGVSGKKASEVYTDRADVTAYLTSYHRKEVVIVWIGTNDLKTADTDTTIYNNIKNSCLAFRNAGAKVVVGNILVRGDATAGEETKRLSVNAMIAANYSTFAHRMFDVTSDPRLQNASDLTYFQADTIHLNATGEAVVAPLVVDAIDHV